MKRLFTLKWQNGQLYMENGQPVYFDNKTEAKKKRDRLDSGFKVSPGPDHKGLKSRRGRTHTRSRRTHTAKEA